MKNYLLLLALAASFTISSCSKDDDDEPAPVTNVTNNNTTIPNPLSGIGQGSTDPAVVQFTKEMLTGTQWQLTALLKGVDNTANFRDMYKDIPACQRDNGYAFASSGNTLTVSDGLEWCGNTEQTISGSWAMANSAKLAITASGLTQSGLTGDFTIVQLSETTLVLQQKANGFTYVATYEKYVAPPAELLMLINKDWKLVSDITHYPTFTVDNFANAQACEKDNFWRFSGNGTLTIDEGPTKCFNYLPQTSLAGFSIYGNTLYIYGERYTVVKNTATELELNYYYYYQGFNVLNTTKFIKQ